MFRVIPITARPCRILLFSAICWDYIQTNVGGRQHFHYSSLDPFQGLCLSHKKVSWFCRARCGRGRLLSALPPGLPPSWPAPCRGSNCQTRLSHSLLIAESRGPKKPGPQSGTACWVESHQTPPLLHCMLGRESPLLQLFHLFSLV